MKNELTLKRGVILAAAVLLIACCAFAGAAAADPERVVWDSTNVTYMVSNGGEYIVDVYGTEIQSIAFPIVTKDLTLDFHYGKYTVSESGGYTGGVIDNSLSIDSGIVFTIKNLFLDGGTVSGSSVGGVIGYYKQNDKSSCCLIFENVSVKNITISATSGANFAAGILGAQVTGLSKFQNCTVEGCSISSSTTSGGLIGELGSASNQAVCIENCKVLDTYIRGGGKVGGLIGCDSQSTSYVINKSLVKNCVIRGTVDVGMICGTSRTRSGSLPTVMSANCGLIGVPIECGNRVLDCEGINNVVVSTGSGSSGGVIGNMSISTIGDDVLTIENNEISYCTIMIQGSSGLAGGFAGTLKEAAVNSIADNTIANCCVVATNGDAAGFCPSVV